MSKSSSYSNKLQGFAERIKTEPVELPLQKVTPVESVPEQSVAPQKDEQQLNVWISKELMKRLKVKGIESDKSLKLLVTEALEQYLS